MAASATQTPSSISQSISIFVDGLCIRCDKDQHYHEDCLSFSQWQQTSRFQTCRQMGLAQLVEYVRNDRVRKVMGYGSETI